MRTFIMRASILTSTLAALCCSACSSPATNIDGTSIETDAGEDDVSRPENTSPGDPGTTDPLPPEVTSHLDLPTQPHEYAPDLPEHFRVQAVTGLDNTPGDNPITNDGATLGRVLFYDTALSANRSLACASCHAPDATFGDTTALSEGFEGGLTGRNSMALVNVRFYPSGRMFWDERADSLEDQVLMPIQDAVEMGLTLDELVARVEAEEYYAPLFERAFGDDEISAERISRALAQFVRSLVSYRSRFDAALEEAGDIRNTFSSFSPQEEMGKQLFLGRARCGTCHLDNPPPPPGAPGGPNLANQVVFQLRGPANNGLDAGPVEDDNGIGDQTGNAGGNGVFKSTSLRNIALSAPYMHDGRFETLAEVVSFYNEDIAAHPNLDRRLQTQEGQPLRLGLDPQEQAALVAFLGTLTDEAMTAEVRFSNPFLEQP